MTPRTSAWLGGVFLALGILGVWGPWRVGGPLPYGAPGGMMGGGVGGMMGGGATMMGGTGSANGSTRISAASVAALVRQGETGARIDRAADTITYRGRTALVVALASPHGAPNMTWEIDGLVNPTIRIPAGTRVTVDLVNTDWGYWHGFELTPTPPPYPDMAMMGIANQFLLMPLPERTTQNLATAQYATRSGRFTATRGTYYYLCPVPGHAQQGMYGKLVIS